MIHKAREDQKLFVRSMGKTLQIIAVTDNDDDEANKYMTRNDRAAVVAVFGPFVFLADKHDAGER